MRHGTRTQSFSRPHNQRVALFRGLLVSLITHERISTTVAKAKELRRLAEKAITLGKRGSLADRRLLLSRVPHKETVAKVFETLAPRFKDRNGGYTRIYKVGRRPGDSAEMALIEFIDADLTAGKVDKNVTKNASKAKKALAAGSPEDKAAAKEAKAKERAEKSAQKKEAKAKVAAHSAKSGEGVKKAKKVTTKASSKNTAKKRS